MPIGDWSTSTTRSSALEPADRAVRAGRLLLAALEAPARRAVEHVLDQAALARARDAGHRGQPAEREARGHVLAGCGASRPRR